MTCGGNISVSSTFSTTTSHPSNAIFRLYFPSCIPASTSRGEGAVVLNNDLRWPSWCANIFSLFLSCTLRAYTSMKRRTYDPAPPPVNPPLSFCDVHVNAIPSKSRKIYYLPREIYIPAVSVSIFTRAEWGKGMEREIVLWELIRSLNVYGPPVTISSYLHHY